MQFNASGLLKGPIGAIREYDIEEWALEDLAPDAHLVQPLTGHVRLMRTGSGVLVVGHVQTQAEMMCSRCLTPIYVGLDVSLEEEFVPTVEVNTGAALAWEDLTDDEAVLISGQHIVDIAEVVRQNLLLALPMQPLCRANCKGLCPECGQNLNEGSCGCDVKEIDPRWAVLAQMASSESDEINDTPVEKGEVS